MILASLCQLWRHSKGPASCIKTGSIAWWLAAPSTGLSRLFIVLEGIGVLFLFSSWLNSYNIRWLLPMSVVWRVNFDRISSSGGKYVDDNPSKDYPSNSIRQNKIKAKSYTSKYVPLHTRPIISLVRKVALQSMNLVNGSAFNSSSDPYRLSATDVLKISADLVIDVASNYTSRWRFHQNEST